MKTINCLYPLVCLAVLATWSFFFDPTLSRAHPHVFVDNTVAFEFDAKGLAGVREHWVFDDMFGTMILEDYDRNRDGAFSEQEVAIVKKEAFDNLHNFDWFTNVWVDGAAFKVSRVEQFLVGVREGKVFYEFFVPCAVPAGSGQHVVLLNINDSQYYTDVYTSEDIAPQILGAEPFDASATVRINSEKTYSDFQVWATDITLRFAAK